jgi:hypothetical protein
LNLETAVDRLPPHASLGAINEISTRRRSPPW